MPHKSIGRNVRTDVYDIQSLFLPRVFVYHAWEFLSSADDEHEPATLGLVGVHL